MVQISNIPSLGIMKLVGEIDNTTVNPTVVITPISAVKPKTAAVPAGTLLTEIPLLISSNKMLTLGSERMWLTGGTADSVADTVTYTATVRGLYSGNTGNPPVAADGNLTEYKEHKNDARCIIDETWLTRALDVKYSNASNTFSRALEASQGVVAAGVAMSQNAAGEFKKGFTGTDVFISVTGATAPAEIEGARYFASGFTVPGSIGADVFGDLTTGALSATGGSGKKKVGTHAINSSGTEGVSILPEADSVDLTQNQVEAPTDTTFGKVSAVRLDQAVNVTRPLFKGYFYSDMSDLTRNSATGTGTESITAQGTKFSCTTGQFSTFVFTADNFGEGVIVGRKIFKFTIGQVVSFAVDLQEMFVGLAQSVPATTTLASVDTGFAGFQIKRESGTVNVYALTKEENSAQTRELVATGLASGDVFSIDFTAATTVKYYITKSGTTTLEATHSTTANIPVSGSISCGWLFNGAGSGTPEITFSSTSVEVIS